MKIYQYTCTLESDLIISSKAATEGQSQSLDFIPGAKFLGIVANQLYRKSAKESVFDLFHNGKVAFGNAYPKISEEDLLPIPAAFFYPKGKSLADEILLPMNLEPGNKYLNQTDEEIQPKQARGGYFSFSKKIIFTPEQNFRLKSAYDVVKRRSADGQMFGYFSLPKGLILHFSVRDSTEQYAELIKTHLVGLKRIGRSKSAEYGLVNIQFEKEVFEKLECAAQIGEELILFALSDLCFVDEYGQYTSIPTPQDLTGSTKNEIVWTKCQVRSRKHPVWNGKRESKDADRILIEKGSVFVIKINEALPDNFFDMGIGVLKSEGLGQVLLNPSFIPIGPQKLDFKLNKQEEAQFKLSYPNIAKDSQDLVKALKSRKSFKDIDRHVKLEVDNFIQSNKKSLMEPTKSQWGTIRGYAKQALNFDAFFKMTFENEFGFIYRGRSESQWRNAGNILKDKLEKLKKSNGQAFTLDFVQKLSAEMPKLKES